MAEDRTITIDDVARLAGVSRATAGRVVGNYGSVSEKSKERVWEAVKQLDYNLILLPEDSDHSRQRLLQLSLEVSEIHILQHLYMQWRRKHRRRDIMF